MWKLPKAFYTTLQLSLFCPQHLNIHLCKDCVASNYMEVRGGYPPITFCDGFLFGTWPGVPLIGAAQCSNILASKVSSSGGSSGHKRSSHLTGGTSQEEGALCSSPPIVQLPGWLQQWQAQWRSKLCCCILQQQVWVPLPFLLSCSQPDPSAVGGGARASEGWLGQGEWSCYQQSPKEWRQQVCVALGGCQDRLMQSGQEEGV